jgi:outer membrane lipoprotein SlyB
VIRGRFLALSLALGMIAATLGAHAQPNAQQTIRYGTVVSVDRAVVEVQAGNVGASVGASVGAVAGAVIAGRQDRWLGGLIGGALGGAAGHAADRSARKKPGWQLIILLEETGEEIGVQVVGKKQIHHPEDRVRLLSAGGKTQVDVIESSVAPEEKGGKKKGKKRGGA